MLYVRQYGIECWKQAEVQETWGEGVCGDEEGVYRAGEGERERDYREREPTDISLDSSYIR